MYNVEELIQKNDLIVLAERAGASFKKLGKDMRSCCPLHGGHNPTGFSVYEEGGKQRWMCYTDSCGHGDVIDFVVIWQHKTFTQAVEFLGGEVIMDAAEMQRLADERHKRAVYERERAEKIEAARRAELQSENKHLWYHEHMTQFFVDEWIKRGLDECWQGFWNLGGCPDFVVNETWHTPTLTIPVQNEKYEILNIKHRLLNPPNPNDRYRPEKTGLGKFPYFLSYPDLGYGGDVVWVIEGEIKSAVTATINPNSNWQYIGVPGRSQYGELVGKLKGKNVIVVPDPGSEEDAGKFCKEVNGRWVELPRKIDDLIVEHKYDQDWLFSLEKQARRVK